MIHRESYDEVLDGIIAKDPRYHRDAYHFVREGLDYTQQSISKQQEGIVRHISGQELLGGMRSHALEEYGPMAMMVLGEWGAFGAVKISGRSCSTWWSTSCLPRPTKIPAMISLAGTISRMPFADPSYRLKRQRPQRIPPSAISRPWLIRITIAPANLPSRNPRISNNLAAHRFPRYAPRPCPMDRTILLPA